MRKFLLLPLVLLLAACQPLEADEENIVTSGGVAVVDRLIEETAAVIEGEMLGYWPYFQTWDSCVINGETLNNVTFTYTNLGLAYVVDATIYYVQEMEVESCQTVILEVNDTESNIR